MTRKRAPGVGTPRASGAGKGRRDAGLPSARATRRARTPKPAADETFVAFVVDQLASLPEVRSRRMFGGHGLYSGAMFFAVVDEGRLYFRVDDASRPEYEARGIKPFNPMGSPMLGYWEVPGDVVEDAAELTRWARKAVAARR